MKTPDRTGIKVSSVRTKCNNVQKTRKHVSVIYLNAPSDNWVNVHNLRQRDGGILDPDDRLNDVADDREQIVADFDEANESHQGDGTSASDQSETPSPDIFTNLNHKFEPFSNNGIEITGEELNGTPPPLHVRRGSEPALNRLSPIPSYNRVTTDQNKRWSAAPMVDDDIPSSSTPVKDKMNHSLPGYSDFYDGFPGERGEGSGEEKNPSSATSSGCSHHSATLHRFSRDVNRCSVQILSDNPSMSRWADAADRAANDFNMRPEAKRREPVGGVAAPVESSETSPIRNNLHLSEYKRHVILPNDGSPLGIHVIPSTDKSGNDLGLLVEGIEPDGRVARDGKIKIHDIIIEINGQMLKNVTFHQAQQIFKDAMNADELRLLVIKKNYLENSDTNTLVASHKRTLSEVSKVANVTATRKVPAASLSSRTQSVILQSNTRRIGKKVQVNLVKGDHGLGFSITTRDNPAGGEAPIYIKNILPKGAAIEEGNLKIGDRLLEVNSIAVTGYSQGDVANLLRQIPIGKVAALVVSRQERPLTEVITNFDYRSVNLDDHDERNPDSPKLPRQLTAEKTMEDSLIFPWKQREILTFEIPVHDSERAGLGVSVKGKTSSGQTGNVDLGIFVKNVIHGGAASKDGRLRQNDQLVNINSITLLGKSNSQAMNTLRTATYEEGPIPGMITLTIARRLDVARDNGGLRSGRDSVNSFGTTSSGTETLTLGGTKSGYTTPSLNHSGTSVSNSTVVYVRPNEKVLDKSYGYDYHPNVESIPSNPVIQRITGENNNKSMQRMVASNNNQALRNDSYYRATHETWNNSHMQHYINQDKEFHPEDRNGTERPQMALSTVHPSTRETVIIHDDEYRGNESMHRYNTTPTKITYLSGSRTNSDQPSQCSDTSQISLEESIAGFSRDQVGRQSISEKRHATLDAKSTDTYQRSKKAREEREKHQKETDDHNGFEETCIESTESREVGIDLPPRENPIDLPSSENPIVTKCKPASKPRTYIKNSTISSKLYGLKAFSKLSDLKSYTGRSMTLQPANRKAQCKLANASHMRSLRNLPSGQYIIKCVPKAKQVVNEDSCRNASKTPLVLHKSLSPAATVSNNDSKLTFGHELSSMIRNWASRNHSLLRRSPTPVNSSMARASSEESLQKHEVINSTLPRSQDFNGNKVTSRRNPKDIGPGLGMRKSSSLESLQTMVQEMTMEETGKRQGTGKVPRGRGCNESFRAAVDRSYDAPLSNSQMETLNEEESESFGSGFGRNNSRQSSVNSSVDDRKKHYRKRQGLLKGLGSMFRFGKHRKTPDHENEAVSSEAARKYHQEERDRMQSHYKKMLESHQHQQALQNKQYNRDSVPDEDSNPSRSERMHQLRAEHQRRHAERNCVYPTDDIEESYDACNKKRMEPVPPEPKVEIEHIRAHSYDVYGSNRKRQFRPPFQDPNNYSHYVNYEQIQKYVRLNKEQERLTQLASQQYQDFRDKQTRRVFHSEEKENEAKLLYKLEERFIHESVLASREQREYQSQRSSRDASFQQKPVSNYFEYESVQAMMSHAQNTNKISSLPRRTNHNSSYPRQHHSSNGYMKNGPVPKQAPKDLQQKQIHPSFCPPNKLAYSSGREGIYAASGFRPASQYQSQKKSNSSFQPDFYQLANSKV